MYLNKTYIILIQNNTICNCTASSSKPTFVIDCKAEEIDLNNCKIDTDFEELDLKELKLNNTAKDF